MTPTIYKIEFPNGGFYIGSTMNFSERRRTHLRHGRKGRAVNQKLQAAFDAYPVCGVYQIATGFDRATLHLLEQQIIDQECPPLNVNCATPLPAEWDGKARPFGPYASLRIASNALGVCYQDMKRLAAAYSYEAAIYKLAYVKPQRQVKPKGGPPDPRKQPYAVQSPTGWEDRVATRIAAGVSSNRYNKRMKAGWGDWEAVSTPPGPRRVTTNYMCQKHGVPFDTYTRRRAHGWTVQQAMGLRPPPHEPRKPKVKKRYLTAGGKTQSLDAWAQELGITKSALTARLDKGLTPEQATGLTKTERQIRLEAQAAAVAARPKRPTFTLNGFTGTIADIARHFGVPDSQIRSRQKMGWPTSQWLTPVKKATSNEEMAAAAEQEYTECRLLMDEMFPDEGVLTPSY